MEDAQQLVVGSNPAPATIKSKTGLFKRKDLFCFLLFLPGRI